MGLSALRGTCVALTALGRQARGVNPKLDYDKPDQEEPTNPLIL